MRLRDSPCYLFCLSLQLSDLLKQLQLERDRYMENMKEDTAYWQDKMRQMSEHVRCDLQPPSPTLDGSLGFSRASVKWESCHLLWAAQDGCVVFTGVRWGERGHWSSLPAPHMPLLCFGQMHKLRDEKDHSVCQVQELEASVAALKRQLGKPGLDDLRAGLVAEGWSGCLGVALGAWTDGRGLWPREGGLYQELASLGTVPTGNQPELS